MNRVAFELDDNGKAGPTGTCFVFVYMQIAFLFGPKLGFSQILDSLSSAL